MCDVDVFYDDIDYYIDILMIYRKGSNAGAIQIQKPILNKRD